MTDYKMLSDTEINKAIAEKLGICWHEIAKNIIPVYTCSCGKELYLYADMNEHIKASNPDFCTNAKVLLNVLEDSDDYLNILHPEESFVNQIGAVVFDKYTSNPIILIEDKYILDPRQLAIEYLRWKK